MNFSFLHRYKPLIYAVAFAAVALAFYIANFVFTEPAGDCCATEWDPAPYQQMPVESAP